MSSVSLELSYSPLQPTSHIRNSSLWPLPFWSQSSKGGSCFLVLFMPCCLGSLFLHLWLPNIRAIPCFKFPFHELAGTVFLFLNWTLTDSASLLSCHFPGRENRALETRNNLPYDKVETDGLEPRSPDWQAHHQSGIIRWTDHQGMRTGRSPGDRSFSAGFFFTKIGLGWDLAHGPSGPSFPAPPVAVFKYRRASPEGLAEHKFLGSIPRDSNSAGLGKSPSILICNKFPGDRRYWCWYYTLGEPPLRSNFFILYVRRKMPEIPIQFLTRGHTASKWGNWGFAQNLIYSENTYEVPTLFWALC